MRAVAVDSSSSWISTAVYEGDCFLAEQTFHAMGKGGEELPSAIAEMLGRTGYVLSDIDHFILGAGPGSYTGLRMGFASVKALAYAMCKPVSTVSSLMALAWGYRWMERPVAVVVDARVGEFYCAAYDFTGKQPRVLAPEVLREPKSVVSYLPQHAVLVWPNSTVIEQQIGGFPASFHVLRTGNAEPLCRAGFLIEIFRRGAIHKTIKGGDITQLAPLEPYYLRPSEAERNYDAQNKEAH